MKQKFDRHIEVRGSNKRARSGKYHEINEAMYTWYNLQDSPWCPLMAQCFKKKPWKFQSDWTAKVFEQLKASSGWLEKWKATYGIVNSLVEGV